MTETLKKIFKEKGISPSYTRMRIYYYLDDCKTHPTVDTIYKELIDELPTLSKTTVYNVVKLFVEKELAYEVNIGTNEKRYELVIEKHSHFICQVCNTIYDIPHICRPIDEDVIPGFEIIDQEVNLKGICPNCKHKEITHK
ncbi:MAG: Transcriptional regulator PerR [Candidatus Izimaplasma bacterium HR2]|nr:MAG: Transcriptional regulator PerR [Candidatus Izimaplasma bacterium HR2]